MMNIKLTMGQVLIRLMLIVTSIWSLIFYCGAQSNGQPVFSNFYCYSEHCTSLSPFYYEVLSKSETTVYIDSTIVSNMIYYQSKDSLDYTLKVSGTVIINENFKALECPTWYKFFELQINHSSNWIEWRRNGDYRLKQLSPTLGWEVSHKKRKWKKPTKFVYKAYIPYLRKLGMSKTARLKYEYKPNKYAYSKPFEVGISQEQWDWILNYNKTSRNEPN